MAEALGDDSAFLLVLKLSDVEGTQLSKEAFI